MNDLFPETLLVSRIGERIYTTSVKMAEHFGKRHDNVMTIIRRVLADTPAAERLLNFEESFGYFASANGAMRQRPIYELTHDGFAVVAMGFTGPEAMAWKWAFLSAFRQQEAELAAANARYLAALDQIRPSLRPVVRHFEDGLPRRATAAHLGKTVGSVSYHRGQARRLGLLPVRARVEV